MRIVRDGGSHPATRRGQCHLHFYFRAAVWFLDQLAIVDQAEVDDVDRDFRIVALAELVPDRFFIDRSACAFRLAGLSPLALAVFPNQARRDLFRDAGQTLISRDRVAAAESCVITPGVPAGMVVLLPLGIWIASIAGRREFGVFVHKIENYSLG